MWTPSTRVGVITAAAESRAAGGDAIAAAATATRAAGTSRSRRRKGLIRATYSESAPRNVSGDFRAHSAAEAFTSGLAVLRALERDTGPRDVRRQRRGRARDVR